MSIAYCDNEIAGLIWKLHGLEVVLVCVWSAGSNAGCAGFT